MPYMLLIMEPHGQRAERGLAGGQQAYARMVEFGDSLKARGLLRATESLASTDQAVRLQVRDGQSRLVDGPFAETKEMVGGFFLIDCATRDEAVAIAQACPAAEWATIEVREVAPCYHGAES
ncbi:MULTISPECIES: YciI family protein [unclassified Acidovorax]|uniref:YciI family protein n=1 Tax=unclassified Acidovorax TaxID=2684926 RepID=UPI003ED01699